MDTSPWRDEFKNDAYMAKDRLDAYERGKKPLMMKGIFYELLSAIYYYGFVGIIFFSHMESCQCLFLKLLH